jgi:DNA-directed RNA polymerase subunit beta'
MFDRNKYKFFYYFYFMIDQYKHKQLQIGLVSPQQIQAWAKKILPNGEVVGEAALHFSL